MFIAIASYEQVRVHGQQLKHSSAVCHGKGGRGDVYGDVAFPQIMAN